MVSFDLTDDQKMIRDTVVDFAKNEIRGDAKGERAPKAQEADEHGKIPDEVVQKGWGLGLLQQLIPEQYGGFGGQRSAVTGSVVAEELAWGDLSMATHLLAPALFAIPVMAVGTPSQKEKYLKMFTGNAFPAATAAVVEPRFGFDLESIQTTAQPTAKGYELSGTKCFVPLGLSAKHILVWAVPKDSPQAVSGFIVDVENSGGLKVEREKNMGLKALETAEITFEKTVVPIENRLGEGKKEDFVKLMSASRVALASMAVGVAKAAFEYAREYAKTRIAFGEPIAQRQSIAFMLAEMAMEIDATRLLAWEAAWLMDTGKDAFKAAYLAKMYASDMVMKATDRAVQILGGHGYIRDHPVEMWMRNARGFATWEGLSIV